MDIYSIFIRICIEKLDCVRHEKNEKERTATIIACVEMHEIEAESANHASAEVAGVPGGK